MKKLIILLLALFAVESYAAVNAEAVAELKKGVKAVNEVCPLNLGMMGTLVGAQYDEVQNEVIFLTSLDEDFVVIDMMKKNEDNIAETLKLSMSRGSSKMVAQNIVDAGASLSLRMKGNKSGEVIKAKLTLQQLKEALASEKSQADINRGLYNELIKNGNAGCPVKVAEGMVMTGLIEKGNNLVYDYRVDEKICSIQEIKAIKNDFKDMLKMTFNDPVMRNQIYILSSLGKGLEYDLQGTPSGEKVEIIFTPQELYDFIHGVR